MRALALLGDSFYAPSSNNFLLVKIFVDYIIAMLTDDTDVIFSQLEHFF